MKEKIYLLLKITQKRAETHKFILRSKKKKRILLSLNIGV